MSQTEFVSVDPAYYKVRLLSWLINTLIYLAIALVPLILSLFSINVPQWLIIVPPLVVVLIAVWVLYLIRRRVRALGYAERAEDLVVRSGVLVRKRIVIPYGRLQYVEMTSGPLERRYKLCRLTMNTAAGAATAMIPGLPAEVGADLRERLVAAGEEKMIGL
ncbi:PH domain-containing protein [Glutamicibacter uratoxydans]|uniref:PH domain-containing protein n=1 Tax=Glutamicibacter uratoxydans TaxID=43667 RepID=UPI003D70095C